MTTRRDWDNVRAVLLIRTVMAIFLPVNNYYQIKLVIAALIPENIAIFLFLPALVWIAAACLPNLAWNIVKAAAWIQREPLLRMMMSAGAATARR